MCENFDDQIFLLGLFLNNRDPTFTAIGQQPALAVRSSLDNIKSILVNHVTPLLDLLH